MYNIITFKNSTQHNFGYRAKHLSSGIWANKLGSCKFLPVVILSGILENKVKEEKEVIAKLAWINILQPSWLKKHNPTTERQF